MSKAANMAKVSAKGGFNLLWGMVASTVISALGTIVVANLLGAANYGLYTIALVAPGLISLFVDWGVGSAMTKYTAQCNAEDKAASIRSIFTAGILFETILGITLSAAAFLLSGSLAMLYSLPNITPLIQIASFTILTGALFSAAQYAFTGFEKFELTSFTLVCQAIVKTTVTLVLVIAGLGPLGAVIGITTAALIACVIGAFLMWTLYRSLPKPSNSKLEIMANIKTMLNYGLPLSIATITYSLQIQFYSFILPIFVRPDLIGNYGIANTFVVLITFFTAPITTVLFPAFSKLDPQKDRETLKNVFQFSIKYASLFVVPAAFVVMTLSQPVISVLFPKYTAAPLFLALLAINYLYTAFGSQSISSFVNGQGQTRFYLKITLFQEAVGFPLAVILIPRLGVIGLIITALADGCPGLIVALWWIRKQYGVTVDWVSSVKIFLSSATASAATYTIISIMPFGNWIRLIIGAIIFTVVLVTVILLTKTISRSDVNNLRDMLTEFGLFRRLFNFLLTVIEKLMTATRYSPKNENTRFQSQNYPVNGKVAWNLGSNKRSKLKSLIRRNYETNYSAPRAIDSDLQSFKIERKLFFTTARDRREYIRSVTLTSSLISKLIAQKVDVFTFVERSWCSTIQFPPKSWAKAEQSVVLLNLHSYDEWFKAIGRKSRNMIRKAEKSGVRVSVAEPNEKFSEGIWKIYNNTPIKQNRRNWYFGMTLKEVEEELSSSANCTFIGAYFKDELIGFTSLIYGNNVVVVDRLASLQEHWDKAVNNALIAKTIEICAANDSKWVVYGAWKQMRQHGSLVDFAFHNGFRSFKATRYFVPLTRKGQIAIKMLIGLEANPVVESARYSLHLIALSSNKESIIQFLDRTMIWPN